MNLARSPILWGWIGSLVLVIAFVFFMSSSACLEPSNDVANCGTKWSLLKSSSPNEIGDTLAGFAGSLALLWIVVTVLLQSKELKAQREELQLTRFELAQMSESQAQQVSLMDAQTKLLVEQRKEEVSIDCGKIAEQKFKSLITQFSSHYGSGLTAVSEHGEAISVNLTEFLNVRLKAGADLSKLRPEIHLETFVAALDFFKERALNPSSEIYVPDEFFKLHADIKEVENWVKKADPMTRERFSELNFEDYVVSLSPYLEYK